jgi:hypothetical protein
VPRRLGVGAILADDEPLSLAMRLRSVIELLEGLHCAHELAVADPP